MTTRQTVVMCRRSIGDNSAVAAGGAVTVAATSLTLTKAVARGGTGGGVATIVPIAHATHSGDTTAAVGSNTGVAGASLAVTATATTDVRVEVLTVGIGLAGVAGGEGQAQSSGLTEARVGAAFGTNSPASPRQVIVTGAVLVRAAVAQTAVADTSGGTGGVIGIGGMTDGRSSTVRAGRSSAMGPSCRRRR